MAPSSGVTGNCHIKADAEGERPMMTGRGPSTTSCHEAIGSWKTNAQDFGERPALLTSGFQTSLLQNRKHKF